MCDYHYLISHWYCMLCAKMFFHYSTLNYNEFKQRVIGKQATFTHIAKPAIPNIEKFIIAINLENNITKYFTIKDLNSAFSDIGSPFSLFHLNENYSIEHVPTKSDNGRVLLYIKKAIN